MATAFTAKERASIEKRLREVALECAASLGMRRTTVDELARRAGISKGAFYSFFESKEHLFLSMLEQVHSEIYGRAKAVFDGSEGLPPWQRAALAMKEVCRATLEKCILPFTQDELPLLLRRLPDQLLLGHYHSDEEHLQQLLEEGGLKMSLDIDTVGSIARLLLMSLMFRQEIGPGFDRALDALIDGACKEFVQP